MDTGSIIIGAIIAALIALPLVWMNASTLQRNKKLLHKLTDMARPIGSTISTHDCWSDSAIGIDETRRLLYFYRVANDRETIQQVDLSKIKACRLLKEKDDSQHLRKLQLIFSPSLAGQAEIRLEFFDHEVDLQISRERILAEKWEALVNKLLQAQPVAS